VIRNASKIFVGKPERKRPLGIPRRRWKDNIKWIFKGTLSIETLRFGSGSAAWQWTFL
jgi:hypothetical protein